MHKNKLVSSKVGKVKIKKEKKRSSDSEGEESEHELSYYLHDKVKLMKEVIKILHPKKIKSMAPEHMRHLDMAEISSILLEELLGISNKRLKKIFIGDNVDTSSSESDIDDKSIDVISLDDISDDEDFAIIEECNEDSSKKGKQKIKSEPKGSKRKSEEPTDENEKLMSVLELLELQARARAIRSQLALEAERKKKDKEAAGTSKQVKEEDSDPEAVIVDSPKNEEIVISSSESEAEEEINKSKSTTKSNQPEDGDPCSSKDAASHTVENSKSTNDKSSTGDQNISSKTISSSKDKPKDDTNSAQIICELIEVEDISSSDLDEPESSREIKIKNTKEKVLSKLKSKSDFKNIEITINNSPGKSSDKRKNSEQSIDKIAKSKDVSGLLNKVRKKKLKKTHKDHSLPIEEIPLTEDKSENIVPKESPDNTDTIKNKESQDALDNLNSLSNIEENMTENIISSSPHIIGNVEEVVRNIPSPKRRESTDCAADSIILNVEASDIIDMES